MRTFLRFFLFSLLIPAFQAHGNQLTFPPEEPLFVSLGGNCHTAIALREINLRKASFPFDWFITSDHKNFIKTLEEDFNYFTDENYFLQIEDKPSMHNYYYDFYFIHDFNLPEFAGNREAEWDAFKEKYARRVERFRELRKHPGKVFFIRTLWSMTQEGTEGQFSENSIRTLELKNALDRYFPLLDYTLIIWSHTDLDIPALEPIDKVVEFRISKSNQALHHKILELLHTQ